VARFSARVPHAAADLLAETAPAGQHVTPLNEAIEGDCPTELIGQLIDHGTDPNTPNRAGHSPYRQAVRRDRTDIADLLRAHGARDDTPRSTPVCPVNRGGSTPHR